MEAKFISDSTQGDQPPSNKDDGMNWKKLYHETMHKYEQLDSNTAAEIATLRKQCEELKKKHQQDKECLTQKDIRISKDRDLCQTLMDKLHKEKSKATQKDENITRLDKQIVNLQRENDALKREKYYLEGNTFEKERKIVALENQLEEIQNSHPRQEEVDSELLNEVERMTQMYNKLMDQCY